MDLVVFVVLFFFSSRRRHTSYIGDWSSDVCSSDLWQAVTSNGPEIWSSSNKSGKVWNAPGIGSITMGTRTKTDSWNTIAKRSEERRVGKEGNKRRTTEGECTKHKRDDTVGEDVRQK